MEAAQEHLPPYFEEAVAQALRAKLQDAAQASKGAQLPPTAVLCFPQTQTPLLQQTTLGLVLRQSSVWVCQHAICKNWSALMRLSAMGAPSVR